MFNLLNVMVLITPTRPTVRYRVPSCWIGRYHVPSCPIGHYRADMPTTASHECCRHVATLWYIDLFSQYCFGRYKSSCVVFLSLLVCGIESVVPLYLACHLGSVRATYALWHWRRTILSIGHLNVNRSLMNLRNNSVQLHSLGTLTTPSKLS